jgi:hypothetical protein
MKVKRERTSRGRTIMGGPVMRKWLGILAVGVVGSLGVGGPRTWFALPTARAVELE